MKRSLDGEPKDGDKSVFVSLVLIGCYICFLNSKKLSKNIPDTILRVILSLLVAFRESLENSLFFLIMNANA